MNNPPDDDKQHYLSDVDRIAQQYVPDDDDRQWSKLDTLESIKGNLTYWTDGIIAWVADYKARLFSAACKDIDRDTKEYEKLLLRDGHCADDWATQSNLHFRRCMLWNCFFAEPVMKQLIETLRQANDLTALSVEEHFDLLMPAARKLEEMFPLPYKKGREKWPEVFSAEQEFSRQASEMIDYLNELCERERRQPVTVNDGSSGLTRDGLMIVQQGICNSDTAGQQSRHICTGSVADPVDPIPIPWLRTVVAQKRVKGDASKLARWLERRKVHIFKIANKNYAERAELLREFRPGSEAHHLITEYDKATD